MTKHFISAEELLIDSFKLAQKVYQSGFEPDFIVGVWRGGAPIGIAVQEYFDYQGLATDHIAIKSSSYLGIEQQSKRVQVMGLEYLVERINGDSRILLVDDVFDSGKSMQAILDALRSRVGGSMPKAIKLACPWYKPEMNQTALKPNFYCHTTDQWLVFPHELKGLSMTEIAAGKCSEIAKLLKR